MTGFWSTLVMVVMSRKLNKMQARKNFIALNEGFVCEHCQKKVPPIKRGSYRNHCPFCLYSKHVDKDVPGDRQSECQTLMPPIRLEQAGEEYVIVNQCQKCQKISRNKSAPDDDFDKLLEVIKQ